MSITVNLCAKLLASMEAQRQLENNTRSTDGIRREGVDMNSFALSCC